MNTVSHQELGILITVFLKQIRVGASVIYIGSEFQAAIDLDTKDHLYNSSIGFGIESLFNDTDLVLLCLFLIHILI